MILNIIHPYTYKLMGKTIEIGEDIRNEVLCTEMDNKIGELIIAVLNNKLQVVRHEIIDNYFQQTIQKMALEYVSGLNCIYNENVLEVITNNYGLPVPDEKPEAVSNENWKFFSDAVISHSKLEGIISGKDNLFIGGILESCVANFAKYYADFYRKNGEKLFYVPELCVSFNEFEKFCAEDKLKRNGVMPLSYEDALKFVRGNRQI